MRAIVALVVVSLVIVLTAGLASAQPAITPCALTGEYVSSAALAFQGPAQLFGLFTFTPPSPCTPGSLGSVQVALSVLLSGSSGPIPFTGTFPYTVDGAGHLTIGSGFMRGSVGGVTGTGLANTFVFEGDPGLPSTIRLSGTALRVALAPDAAVYDANGAQVGRLLNGNGSGRTADVLLQVNGQTFRATVLRTRFTSPDLVFVPATSVFLTPPVFQSTDCTGSALIPTGTALPSTPSTDLLPMVGIPDGFTAYLPDRSGVIVTVSIRSYRDQSNVCQTIPSTMVVVYPALPPIDLGTFFVPPFTLR